MGIQRFYSEEFYIDVVTSAKSSTGVMKETFTASNWYKGKIDPISVEVNYTLAGTQVRATHNLFCSSDVQIKEKDVVVFNTKKFDVLEVKDPFTKLHHLEVVLRSR